MTATRNFDWRRPSAWIALCAAGAAAVILIRAPKGTRAAAGPSERAELASDGLETDAIASAASSESRRALPTAPAAELRVVAGETSAAPGGEPGAIRGIVLLPSGEPAPNARCELLRGRPSSGPGECPAAGEELPVAELVTAADGAFRFAVAAGLWRLDVRSSGHGTRSEDSLRPGDWIEVRLEPQARIRVELSDESGLSVSGASVRALAGFRYVDAPPIAEATSDAAGVAELGALPAGETYLCIRHPTHELVVRPIELASGATETVRIALARGIRVVTTLRAESSGAPPDGARVRIEAFSKGQSVVLEPARAADGSFATDAIFSPGEVLALRGSAPGFADARMAIAIDPEAGSGEQSVALVLRSAERRARGRAVEAGGKPVAGASVAFTSVAPIGRGIQALQEALTAVTPHAERWISAGRTDAAGAFEIGGLETGREHVVAISAEGRAASIAWIQDGEPGELVELGSVYVERACRLWGRVSYRDGTPAAGASVRAQREVVVKSAELEEWRPSHWWRPIAAKARADGFFRLEGLAPGNQELDVDGEPVGTFHVDADSGQHLIEIALDRDPPAQTAVVAGVVRAASGRAVSSAFVALYSVDSIDAAVAAPAPVDSTSDAAPAAMTFTSVLGEFRLRAPAGAAYALKVVDVHGKFLDHEQRLEALPARSSLSIELEPGPDEVEPIVGLVVGPDGLPLEGIEVALSPPENRWCNCISFLARTNDEGLATFTSIAPDKDHVVSATDPRGRFRAEPYFPVQAGGYFEIVMRP